MPSLWCVQGHRVTPRLAASNGERTYRHADTQHVLQHPESDDEVSWPTCPSGRPVREVRLRETSIPSLDPWAWVHVDRGGCDCPKPTRPATSAEVAAMTAVWRPAPGVWTDARQADLVAP